MAKEGVSISTSDVRNPSMTGNNRAARPGGTECRVSGIDDIGSVGRDLNEEIGPLFGKLRSEERVDITREI